MRTYKQLMAMPLSDLVAIIGDEERGQAERGQCSAALHARLHELNGAGWLILGGHKALTKALSFDTAETVFRADRRATC